MVALSTIESREGVNAGFVVGRKNEGLVCLINVGSNCICGAVAAPAATEPNAIAVDGRLQAAAMEVDVNVVPAVMVVEVNSKSSAFLMALSKMQL